MMMCLTSESMILPKAAPMMTPTARSMTFPLKAKFLNSSKSENAFLVGASDVTLWIESIPFALLGNGSLRGMRLGAPGPTFADRALERNGVSRASWDPSDRLGPDPLDPP